MPLNWFEVERMIMMNNRRAFTIVELIMVVIIIALLLGILLPSVAAIRAKAKETAQKAQLNTIATALEAFKQDYGDYPPSDWLSVAPPPPPVDFYYCGAQKLSEALVGWDLMGFHPQTAWRADGYTGNGAPFVPNCINAPLTDLSYDPTRCRGLATLSERKSPYIELATANVFKLGDLYNIDNAAYVLCDVYKVRRTSQLSNSGKPVMAGSPILYYKANTANTTIDVNYALPPTPPQISFSNRIYDYSNNQPITSSNKLTTNGPTGLAHPFAYSVGNDYPVFYGDKTSYTPGTTYYPTIIGGGTATGYGIRDPRIPGIVRPYNPDTYILISAGPDGYYGTADDIHNY